LKSIEVEQKVSIRNAAQEALWKIDQLGNNRTVATLAEVLANEGDESRKMWAAFRLGELKQVEAIPVLMQALNDESHDVQGRSAAALIRIGEATLPVLRAQMQRGSASGRLYAAAILGYLGSPVDIPLLQDIARQKNQKMMANVAHQSVDLINRFSRSHDGFTELATIGRSAERRESWRQEMR
jgi:HEAT repeat protein